MMSKKSDLRPSATYANEKNDNFGDANLYCSEHYLKFFYQQVYVPGQMKTNSQKNSCNTHYLFYILTKLYKVCQI